MTKGEWPNDEESSADEARMVISPMNLFVLRHSFVI